MPALAPFKRDWSIRKGLLRAFFFDERGGSVARDNAQIGQTATLDSGITWESKYGVNIPRTDGVEVNLDNDIGTRFEILPPSSEQEFTFFSHFRFDGNAADANEFTLSSNHIGSGSSVFNINVTDSTVEDRKEHTITHCVSRNGGEHLYLDGQLIGSDLTTSNSTIMAAHNTRYDSNTNQWEVGISDSGASRANTMIGGTPQKAADRWDGPIYAALYWNRKLDAREAKWLHRNYRRIKDPRTLWIPVGVTPEGTTFFQTNTGSLVPAGALTKEIQKAVAGSLTPIGTIVKDTLKNVSGALTPTSTLIKRTLKSLVGGLTPSGVLATAKTFVVSLAGFMVPSGTTTKQTRKNVAGSATPSGDLNKETRKEFTGSVASSGVLATAKTFTQSVAGALTPSGSLATLFIAGDGPVAVLFRRLLTAIDGLRHRRKNQN